MKRIITILLAFGILAQSFVQVGVVVYFELNKAYISQKLCVNRNNPQMHCNGHCYLSKQLKKAEQTEQKQTQNLTKEKEEIIPNTNGISASYFPRFISRDFIAYSHDYPISIFGNGLIKPPLA